MGSYTKYPLNMDPTKAEPKNIQARLASSAKLSDRSLTCRGILHTSFSVPAT